MSVDEILGGQMPLFRVVGASCFYHFGMTSTGRITYNQGGRMFVMKWGITQMESTVSICLRYARRMAVKRRRICTNSYAQLGCKLRHVRYALRYNYPLDEIGAWGPIPGRCEWIDK